MKLPKKVLSVLDDGPAHCYDVVDELGIPMKAASTVLSYLNDVGLARRTGKVIPSGAKRLCFIYEATR